MFLPKSDQGCSSPLGATKALAAEGVEQKATMQGESKQPSPKDPVLERALSHPKRLAMLGYLMEKKGTGTDEEELVEALSLFAPRVKYHLLVLQNADLIAQADDLEQSGYIAAASAGL
jgi:hypothetical protein